MSGFIQIIEYDTSQPEKMKSLMDEAPDDDESTAGGVVVAQDRDRPGHYFVIVEFESYESAMQNSQRPETDAYAKKMADLCDGPPTFHNLDVLDRRDG